MTLKEVKKKYPNDYNLGNFIRFHFEEINDLISYEIKIIIKNHPNDASLGNYMRHKYNGGYYGNH